MATQRILSIDGGGIRGIIPASALIRLEAVTGQPTRDTFSLLAGTSTGALLAGGLAAGIPAASLRDLYVRRGPDVFRKIPLVTPLLRIVRGWMYDTDKLHAVIREELGAQAVAPLNALPVDVFLTALSVPGGKPWYFVKAHPKNSGRTGGLPLADCVTASAAAPTYFHPWTIANDPASPPATPIGPLVDGGVGVVANPAYEACEEAFVFHDAYTPEDTTLVSLGTGTASPEGRRVPGWLLPWIPWILGEFLDEAAQQQLRLVQRHFPLAGLYRINTTLPRPIGQDDVGRVPDLVRYGDELAARIDWDAILAGTDETFRLG
jgi:patatin-like phospholipase/acyl hydrolase